MLATLHRLNSNIITGEGSADNSDLFLSYAQICLAFQVPIKALRSSNHSNLDICFLSMQFYCPFFHLRAVATAMNLADAVEMKAASSVSEGKLVSTASELFFLDLAFWCLWVVTSATVIVSLFYCSILQRKKELRKELCLLDWMPATLRALGLDTSRIEDLERPKRELEDLLSVVTEQ